jgi:nucleoside-diphosphate-sugar epimerase
MAIKILLTGATGFLGSYLLDSFISQGFDVTVIKRSTSDIWRISHLLDKVKVYNIDNTKLKLIFQEVKPEIIVHTACTYGRREESMVDIINSNLIFGLDLLEESIRTNVKTFINADSLLPRNINDYSLSKAQFTDWLKKKSNQIQVVNFKIEHMYGVNDDDQKFIPWLINKMINEDEIINLTSGIQKRDFIYVTDVVNAFNLIINKRYKLSDWNEFDVGTNVFTEVKEFITEIAILLEKKYNLEIVTRLNFGSVLYRNEEVMVPQLDNRKLMELGWEQKVFIKEGIKKILNKDK